MHSYDMMQHEGFQSRLPRAGSVQTVPKGADQPTPPREPAQPQVPAPKAP